jgi:thymidylate synthase
MSFLKILPPDVQYRVLVKNILKYGDFKYGRNGNTISSFGNKMTFCLRNNKVPFLSTKKLAWKSCLRELLWFMKGSTDNRILTKNNVRIWNGNADKKFLEKRGLDYSIDGDLGPIYGHQWRFFDAEYVDCETNYSGKGVDQLNNIVNSLNDVNDRYSRRLILSAWNPKQLDEMALPPCHVMSQFNVSSDNKLSCLLFQRSGDVGLGVPFNIASYAMLTHILATHCNLQPNKLIHVIGDAHIYEDHIESLKKQIVRPHYNMPEILINKKDHIDDYEFNDIKIKNYKYHPSIKMKMIA